MKQRRIVCLLFALIVLTAGCAAGPTPVNAPSGVPEGSSQPDVSSTPDATPLPTPPTAQAIPLQLDEKTNFDVDGDGNNDMIGVIAQGNEIGVPSTILQIAYANGKSALQEMDGVFLSGFLFVRANGEIGAFLSCDYASDDYVTYSFTMDHAITPATHIYGVLANLNPNESTAQIEGYVDVLGTWGATRECEIGSDFTITPKPDALWMVTMQDDRTIVTKRDLPVDVLRDGNYETVTLPSGTSMTLTATDLSSVAHIALADGTSAKIDIEVREGFTYINGIEDSEWFEDLFYAG